MRPQPGDGGLVNAVVVQEFSGNVVLWEDSVIRVPENLLSLCQARAPNVLEKVVEKTGMSEEAHRLGTFEVASCGAHIWAGPCWVPFFEPREEVLEGQVWLVHHLAVSVLTDIVECLSHLAAVIMEGFTVVGLFVALVAVVHVGGVAGAFMGVHEPDNHVGADGQVKREPAWDGSESLSESVSDFLTIP